MYVLTYISRQPFLCPQTSHHTNTSSKCLFTCHGRPEPRTEDQVNKYVGKLKAELDKGWHIYLYTARVWAQKPLDADERPGTTGESKAESKGQARGEGRTESMESMDTQTGRYYSAPG